MKNADKPVYPLAPGSVMGIGRDGFTKREKFAKDFMIAILSNPTRSIVGENPAKDAVLYADSLLKELENGK